MKKMVETKIASKIVDVAMDTAKNTVGKSIPLLAHEVEMPECLREEFLDKEVGANE